MKNPHTGPRLPCLIGVAMLWSQATAAGTPPNVPALAPGVAHPRTEVRAASPENYCLGGIENRKIIVDESRLTNPFHQTTLLGCQIDGGDPQIMPDLPPASPIQEVTS